jgi:hypothetical protein
VGSPLGKRAVVHQRKNTIKGCLEGGSGKKPSAKDIDKAKPKTMLHQKFKCPNYHELGHRKSSLKCTLNETKKRQFIFFMCTNFDTISSITVLINFLMCGKRKARKNTTKVWFPKNVGDSSSLEDVVGTSSSKEDVVGTSSPPENVVGTLSPPRVNKRVIRKMTPKKNKAE